MWFVGGSNQAALLPHHAAQEGAHVLTVAGITEADGVCCPLQPGWCTVHGGRTLHYTRGNTTDTQRRAYIVNCRPRAMVELERQMGFDHGRGGLHAGFEVPATGQGVGASVPLS